MQVSLEKWGEFFYIFFNVASRYWKNEGRFYDSLSINKLEVVISTVISPKMKKMKK